MSNQVLRKIYENFNLSEDIYKNIVILKGKIGLLLGQDNHNLLSTKSKIPLKNHVEYFQNISILQSPISKKNVLSGILGPINSAIHTKKSSYITLTGTFNFNKEFDSRLANHVRCFLPSHKFSFMASGKNKYYQNVGNIEISKYLLLFFIYTFQNSENFFLGRDNPFVLRNQNSEITCKNIFTYSFYAKSQTIGSLLHNFEWNSIFSKGFQLLTPINKNYTLATRKNQPCSALAQPKTQSIKVKSALPNISGLINPYFDDDEFVQGITNFCENCRGKKLLFCHTLNPIVYFTIQSVVIIL